MSQRLRHQLLAIAAIGVATLPIVSSKALAHQVQTNYILKDQANSLSSSQTQAATGRSIELHSEFPNGEPLKGANVVIYAPNQPGRIWAKGVTSSEGRFDFAPDIAIKGDWEVQITRAGHADILTVPVSANGIEADLVSQTAASDLHYAEASPWAIVGSVLLSAAVIGFTRVAGKRQTQ